MPLDRFLIGPFNASSGLQNDVKPFLIPDNAFSRLKNAYVWRDRVRKRFGSTYIGQDALSSRLRVSIGVTADGAVPPGTTVPLSGATPIVTPANGQAFSIGDTIFTVYDGFAVNPTNLLRSDGLPDAATFNNATGAVVINNVPSGLTIYYYPNLPVMGLRTFEDVDINAESTYAFDTRFAYQYLVDGWERLANEGVAGDAIWGGNNTNFFWTCNWTGTDAFTNIMYVTNNNPNEVNSMRYILSNTWETFRPLISDGIYLNSARIIVPFKNRLVAFNVWIGADTPGDNYRNRAVWCQIGNPLAADAWQQDIPGKGSGVDAPITQAIISVGFIKDRLIVYFERSTYEFVYTGNQAYPFIFQQIDSELGAESTFSSVPFDKVLLGVGNVGIVQCSGTTVSRIDDKIPDEVFRIHNTDGGVERVYGIRDYAVEMAYWSFPAAATATDDFPYPNRVLVYNYKNNTWSFNDDSITCFGYLQRENDVTWDSMTVSWDSDVSWDGFSLQAQFRQVLAGNQQGYTFVVSPDITTNAAVLQITFLTAQANNEIVVEVIDHNMQGGDYIRIRGVTEVGVGNLELLNEKIYKIDAVIDKDVFTIYYPDNTIIIDGTYGGAGLIARVSNIEIDTKEYNLYASQGKKACIPKVNFMVDRTSYGEITVDFYVSTGLNSMVAAGETTGSLIGTSILDTTPYALVPQEANNTRLWHQVCFNSTGQVIQFKLYMSDEQMTRVVENEDGSISGPALVDFQLNSMIIYARPSGRL